MVLRVMNNLNMNLYNCVSISSDGCSVMILKLSGAVKSLLYKMPVKERCPCYNGSLNLYKCRMTKG